MARIDIIAIQPDLTGSNLWPGRSCCIAMLPIRSNVQTRAAPKRRRVGLRARSGVAAGTARRARSGVEAALRPLWTLLRGWPSGRVRFTRRLPSVHACCLSFDKQDGLRDVAFLFRRVDRGRGIRGWRRGACALLRGRIGSEMLSAGNTLGLRAPDCAKESSTLWTLFRGWPSCKVRFTRRFALVRIRAVTRVHGKT